MKTIHIPKGHGILVIGDVHENEDQFNTMLKQVDISKELILVSVGDVYDKGSGIQTANRIIQKIQLLHNDGCAYMVRGNHEQRNINNSKNLSPELLWCSQLPFVLSFVFYNQTRITVVHGGVTPNHTWENISTSSDLMYIRNLDENNNPIQLEWINKNGINVLKSKKDGVPWHERYDGRFGYILSGHISQKDGTVERYKHSSNLDTKCYETGILAGQVVSDGVLKELILVGT